MAGKSRKKMWIIIVSSIAGILLIGIIAFLLSGHYVSIRGQHLNRYHYSTGGGMRGGYYIETIERCEDGQAQIRIEQAEWYNQEPDVKLYSVDAAILDELEDIIRSCRMNFWNGKKFTAMFIADGESKSYSFDFDTNDISFSSQHYPEPYNSKLKRFDAVIEKYIKDAD